MATVKINNKTYTVPELNFQHSVIMEQMGLPLDAYALVAGIYRIIDQIHTSTNSVGDLVASVCISQMEGELDHDIFNQEEAKKAA